MLNGIIEFNEKKCVYSLENHILTIEDLENRDKIYIDELDDLINGKRNSNTPYMLKGKDFSRNREILFFISHNINRTPRTSVYKLSHYIIFVDNEKNFDQIELRANELNWFYNIRNAYHYSVNSNTGEADITVIPFDKLKKEWTIDDESKLEKVYINISRTIKSMDTSPIELVTELQLRFNELIDYEELYMWSKTTIDFLKFITYRKNITINQIALKKLNERGLYKTIGILYLDLNRGKYKEDIKVERERIIDVSLLDHSLEDVFKRLIENTIYLKHIPENSIDRNRITTARFILITAGFEWQFNFNYKTIRDEVSDKNKEERIELLNFINKKISENTGSKKKFYKFHKKIIERVDLNLSNKIKWALDEYEDAIGIFIKSIYHMNGIEEKSYSKIAERIQIQRNNYAHGNIDKDINPIAILDVIVLEWLYYAMVLDSCGMERKTIKKVINQLFKCGF